MSDTIRDRTVSADDPNTPLTHMNAGGALGATSPRPTVRELIIQLTELQDDLRCPEKGWAQRRSLIDQQALVVRELRSWRLSPPPDASFLGPSDQGMR